MDDADARDSKSGAERRDVRIFVRMNARRCRPREEDQVEKETSPALTNEPTSRGQIGTHMTVKQDH